MILHKRGCAWKDARQGRQVHTGGSPDGRRVSESGMFSSRMRFTRTQQFTHPEGTAHSLLKQGLLYVVRLRISSSRISSPFNVESDAKETMGCRV